MFKKQNRKDRGKPEDYTTGWIIIPDWIQEGIAFYEEEKFDDSYIKSRLVIFL